MTLYVILPVSGARVTAKLVHVERTVGASFLSPQSRQWL